MSVQNFSFVKRPKTVIGICLAIFIITITCSILAYRTYGETTWLSFPVCLVSFVLNVIVLCFGWVQVDVDKHLLTVSSDRKHPVKLDNVDRLVRHIYKHGHVKSYTIHEVGVRYLDFHLANKEEFEALIKRINPKIVIRDIRV